MEPAITAFQRVQLGKEVTRGTAVAATESLRATAKVSPVDYEYHRGTHPSGTLVDNSGPTPIVKKGVKVEIDMDATYEQIGWPLSLAIDQPATTGVGPYTHTWDPGIAALWAPHSATAEFRRASDGTNFDDVEVEYTMAQGLKLSGEQNGVLKVNADCFGRQITNATVTALSVPGTLNNITVPEMKFYLNDTWALADLLAPVAGLVSPDIMSFDLEINPGLAPHYGISGATTFSQHVERAKGFKLSCTMLVNPNAAEEGYAAERVHAAAGDLRFITLGFTGPGNLDLYIALAAKHEKPELPELGESDGLDTVTMTFVSHEDVTGAKLIKALLNNDDADPL